MTLQVWERFAKRWKAKKVGEWWRKLVRLDSIWVIASLADVK
jgi:hypothetical protein